MPLIIPIRPDLEGAEKELNAWQAQVEAKYGIKLEIQGDTAPLEETIEEAAAKLQPVEVPVDANTEPAQKTVSDWVQKSTEQLALEAQIGADTGPAKASLNGLEDAAKRTAAAVEGIRLHDVMSTAVGSIGDVKDILQKAGGALFGFNKQTIDSIGLIGDLAEKGAKVGVSLGGMFEGLGKWGGPAGAAAGLAIGALSEYISSLERARAAQEKLTREGVEASFATMQRQRKLLQDSIDTWDDYAVAVRRAGGVQTTMLEGVLAAEEAATKAEVDAIQAKIDAQKINIQVGLKAGELRQRTTEEDKAFFAAQRALADAENEMHAAKERGLDNLSKKLLPELSKAFEESDKSTAEFNKQLAQVGKEKTIEDLATAVTDAEGKLSLAQARVAELKEKLAAKPAETDGFFSYVSNLKLQLIDSAIAAHALSQAQAEVLGATVAKTDGAEKDKEEQKRKNEERIRRQKEADEAFKKSFDLTTDGILGQLERDNVITYYAYADPEAAADAQAMLDSMFPGQHTITYSAEVDPASIDTASDLLDSMFGTSTERDLFNWDKLNKDHDKEADARIAQRKALNKSIEEEEQKAADARAKAEADEYSASVALYASYAGMVTNITGELTAQLEENIAAGNSLFDGMGLAAERGVSQTLKALGKLWGAKAIGEVAEGLADLAGGNAPGALTHFASAAKYGVAAAAAGLGGAALGGDASARGDAADKEKEAKGGGSSAGSGSNGGGGSNAPAGPEVLSPIIVEFGSDVASAAAQLTNAANAATTMAKSMQEGVSQASKGASSVGLSIDGDGSIAKLATKVDSLHLSTSLALETGEAEAALSQWRQAQQEEVSLSLSLKTEEATKSLTSWHRFAREEINVSPLASPAFSGAAAPLPTTAMAEPQQTVVHNTFNIAPNGIVTGDSEEAMVKAGRWVQDVTSAASNSGPQLKGGR